MCVRSLLLGLPFSSLPLYPLSSHAIRSKFFCIRSFEHFSARGDPLGYPSRSWASDPGVSYSYDLGADGGRTAWGLHLGTRNCRGTESGLVLWHDFYFALVVPSSLSSVSPNSTRPIGHVTPCLETRSRHSISRRIVSVHSPHGPVHYFGEP